MDFALIGIIIVVGFILAVMWPHPKTRFGKEKEVVQEPERPGGDVSSTSPEASKPANDSSSTRAA